MGVCYAGPGGNGNVTEIESPEAFQAALEAAGDKLVVLDIATKTCGPCMMVYPKFVALSEEYDDVVFLKIFGDLTTETRKMMKEWGVTAVPMFNYYRNKELIGTVKGAKIEAITEELLKHRALA